MARSPIVPYRVAAAAVLLPGRSPRDARLRRGSMSPDRRQSVRPATRQPASRPHARARSPAYTTFDARDRSWDVTGRPIAVQALRPCRRRWRGPGRRPSVATGAARARQAPQRCHRCGVDRAGAPALLPARDGPPASRSHALGSPEAARRIRLVPGRGEPLDWPAQSLDVPVAHAYPSARKSATPPGDVPRVSPFESVVHESGSDSSWKYTPVIDPLPHVSSLTSNGPKVTDAAVAR
jgi:hypothetical protein